MAYLKTHVDINLIGCTHKNATKKTNHQVITVSAENTMKHSYNDDSGIKMTSNEYDAME